jgi:hypothetical protein
MFRLCRSPVSFHERRRLVRHQFLFWLGCANQTHQRPAAGSHARAARLTREPAAAEEEVGEGGVGLEGGRAPQRHLPFRAASLVVSGGGPVSRRAPRPSRAPQTRAAPPGDATRRGRMSASERAATRPGTGGRGGSHLPPPKGGPPHPAAVEVELFEARREGEGQPQGRVADMAGVQVEARQAGLGGEWVGSVWCGGYWTPRGGVPSLMFQGGALLCLALLWGAELWGLAFPQDKPSAGRAAATSPPPAIDRPFPSKKQPTRPVSAATAPSPTLVSPSPRRSRRRRRAS